MRTQVVARAMGSSKAPKTPPLPTPKDASGQQLVFSFRGVLPKAVEIKYSLGLPLMEIQHSQNCSQNNYVLAVLQARRKILPKFC